MTTTQVAAETVSTSDADDAAFQALEDVAAIASELDDILVVGGQMAFLLLTAFPATGSPFHAFCSVWGTVRGAGPSRLTSPGARPLICVGESWANRTSLSIR